MLLAYLECKNGAPTEATAAALTAARALARETGDSVYALALGPADAAALAAHGVEKVFQLDDDRFQTPAPGAAAKAVHAAIVAQSPAAVVGPSTPLANEVLSRAAALGDWGMASACTSLAVQGDDLQLTRTIWGGSLLQEAKLAGTPKLLTVEAGAFPPQPAERAGAAAVETLAVELTDADFADRQQRLEPGRKEGIALADAKVVVGGGRGVGSEEGFAELDELAGLLNAAVGVTRVATNNGWRPHADQIGQTGAQIAPDVYIAFGISGAIQHMVGCKNAKAIIAINKDAEAPIFQRADYGVIGDLHEVLPELIAAVKQIKAG